MAKLRKKTRAVFTLLACWLILCAPTTPFFSERHPALHKRPTPSKDVIFGRYYFSCADEHINSTLSRADVTSWMNPIQIVTAVVSIAGVLAFMVMGIYLLMLVGFCGCHLAVHWAISGRQLLSPRIYTEERRYALSALYTSCGKTSELTHHHRSRSTIRLLSNFPVERRIGGDSDIEKGKVMQSDLFILTRSILYAQVYACNLL